MRHIQTFALAALGLAAPTLAVHAHAASATQSPQADTDNAAHLRAALAQWKLMAATSGNDAAIGDMINGLNLEAAVFAKAHPADAALAAAAEEVERARAAFWRARGVEQPAMEPQEPRDPRASDEEVIAMAILNHLHAAPSADRQAAILRFGPRAAPALVESARSMNAANALGAPAIALDTLALIDTQKTLEVSWELSAQPSFLVRKAIAEVLSQRMVYSRDEVWVEREGGDQVPAAPEWGALVERLLGEPAVTPRDLRNVLHACATRGYAPQPVIDAILALDREDWPAFGFVPPGARPLIIAGLQHTRADVRRHCASHVSRFPDATPLFALHSDEDGNVRGIVANALGERDVAQRPSSPTGSHSHKRVPPVPGPEHQEALERCLSDEDLQVSRYAAQAVDRAFLQLNIPLLPPPDLARLSTTARNAETRVSLLRVLAQVAPELLAGVAEPTLSDPGVRASEGLYVDAFATLVSGTQSSTHAQAIASAVLAALETYAPQREWDGVFGRSNWQEATLKLLHHLPDRERVQLVQLLARLRPSEAWRFRTWGQSIGHDPAPWIELVQDTSASVLERAVAIDWSLGGTEPTTEHVAAIVEVVKAVARERAAPGGGQFAGEDFRLGAWSREITRALANVNGAQLELQQALFADQSVPSEILLQLELYTEGWRPEEKTALVRAVLKRFPPDSWERAKGGFRQTVLELAPNLEPSERIALIEGALLGSSQNLHRTALYSAGRSRDAKLIDVLRRFSLSEGGRPLLPEVAKAAASFLSDDASRLILELAAQTSSSEARAEILSALQQITDYQTALAKWQQRNDATAVRVRAIAELVAVIDDPSLPEAQRAEALRGLGLLGAVEELPRLVRTLSAPSEALRTAAREALDRLNAAPAK